MNDITLAPCVNWSSAAMIWIIWNTLVLAFHQERFPLPGIVPVLHRTCYCRISWSIIGLRFVVRISCSRWYLTGVSIALLQLPNIENNTNLNHQSPGFKTSWGLQLKTAYLHCSTSFCSVCYRLGLVYWMCHTKSTFGHELCNTPHSIKKWVRWRHVRQWNGQLCLLWFNNDAQHARYCIKSFAYVRLTHWGRVTHICVSKLTIIGSDNGLSPGRRQAIIWTNAGILLIGALGTNVSEIRIKIHTFYLKKMQMSSEKMATILSRPQCVNLLI